MQNTSLCVGRQAKHVFKPRRRALAAERAARGESLVSKPLFGPLCPFSIPDMYFGDPEYINWLTSYNAIPAHSAGMPLALLDCWLRQTPDAEVPIEWIRAAIFGGDPPPRWRQWLKKLTRVKKLGSATFSLDCGLSVKDCFVGELGLFAARSHGSADFNDGGGVINFNFFAKPLDHKPRKGEPEDFATMARRLRREGRIQRIYWLPLLFWEAPRIPLRALGTRLLCHLAGELTHVGEVRDGERNGKPRYVRKESPRPDMAEVYTGAIVPGGKGEPERCPFLDPLREYCGFNGNFKMHRGGGYTIANWTDRVAASDDEVVLQGLRRIAEPFGLIVCGREFRTGQWHSLNNLLRIVADPVRCERLQHVSIRVYSVSDFWTRMAVVVRRTTRVRVDPGRRLPVSVGRQDACRPLCRVHAAGGDRPHGDGAAVGGRAEGVVVGDEAARVDPQDSASVRRPGLVACFLFVTAQLPFHVRKRGRRASFLLKIAGRKPQKSRRFVKLRHTTSSTIVIRESESGRCLVPPSSSSQDETTHRGAQPPSNVRATSIHRRIAAPSVAVGELRRNRRSRRRSPASNGDDGARPPITKRRTAKFTARSRIARRHVAHGSYPRIGQHHVAHHRVARRRSLQL